MRRFCDTLNYVDADVGAATEEYYGVHAGHRNVNGKKNAWCMCVGGGGLCGCLCVTSSSWLR